VTTDVPALSDDEIGRALNAGLARARQILDSGRIWNALLCCQGWTLDTQIGELRGALRSRPRHPLSPINAGLPKK
jgi:hypothetical protein